MSDMRALVGERYGPPEALEVRKVARPVSKSNEVMVRVKAASVNSWDWDQLVGTVQGRFSGLLKPGYSVLGADIAGEIVAIGDDVKRFKIGDAVFGDISGCGWGGFADYVCAEEEFLTVKPEGMNFVEAAAIPQAGLLALQGMRRFGPIKPGQKVLVNGGGGGVGTFAIQMARLAGAEVTGVDSAEKLDVMRLAGADRVMDYARQDFTRGVQAYDLIFDVVARRGLRTYARGLNPGGRMVIVGGSLWTLFKAALLGGWLFQRQDKKMGLLIWSTNVDDLEEMKQLFASGRVRPMIDRTWPLEQGAEALRHLGDGHAKGKVLMVMD